MSEEDKPWRKLAKATPEELQQQQQLEEQPLTAEQQQLVEWLRRTGLVAGAALLTSIWHWNARGRHEYQIFVPPRAATLPPDVVEGWKRSMRFKQGVRVVGRNSLIATGVAALYYGIEAGASRARGGVVDAWNTAAGGAVAGGYLGVYAPRSRLRMAALGSMAGGLLAGASGVAQQWLLEQQRLAEESAEGGNSSSSSSSSSVGRSSSGSSSGGATPLEGEQQKAAVVTPTTSSSQSVPGGNSR